VVSGSWLRYMTGQMVSGGPQDAQRVLDKLISGKPGSLWPIRQPLRALARLRCDGDHGGREYCRFWDRELIVSGTKTHHVAVFLRTPAKYSLWIIWVKRLLSLLEKAWAVDGPTPRGRKKEIEK
jgi:hypothetical protein